MSRYNYIGSYLISSAVQKAVIVNINQSRFLAIAKGTVLELLRLEQDYLKHIREHNFFTYIHDIEVIKNQNTESLAVLTNQHQLYNVLLSEDSISVSQINLKVSVNYRKPKKMLIKINPSSNTLCIYDLSNYFRLFKVNNRLAIENCSMNFFDTGEVKDLEFLYSKEKLVFLSKNPARPTFSLHFFSDYSRDIKEQVIELQGNPGKILQPPTGSLLIIVTQNSYILFDTEDMKEVAEENEEFGDITSKCMIDNTRWIICNNIGKFFLVIFGPSILVKRLGVSISASSIVHLDRGLFFLAGFENLSTVVEIDQESCQMTERSKFSGVSLILEMKFIEDNFVGMFNFLIGTGFKLSGGVSKCFKSVLVDVVSEFSVANVDGVWNLRLGTWDVYFIISILGSSKVLHAEGSNLSAVVIEEFKNNESTLSAFVYENSIIQITRTGIYRYNEKWSLVDSVEMSGLSQSPALFASGCSNTLLVAFRDLSLYCFEITKNSFIQIWNKSHSQEVSCVQSHESLIAVSFWESNSVKIYEKYSGNLKYEESVSLEATPKSLKFMSFSDTLYLFVGLRNGVLVYINLTSNEKFKLNLGRHNVVVEDIHLTKTNFIIASSDSTVILYEHMGKITHACFDISDIQHVCSFHTENIKDALLVSLKDKIAVLSYDNFSKHSFEHLPLSMTAVKIIQLEEFCLVVCKDSSERFILKIISHSFEEMFSTIILAEVHVISCEVVEQKAYLCCNYVDPETKKETGGCIKVFLINDCKLTQVNELMIQSPATAFKKYKEFFILGDRSLRLHKANDTSFECIDSIKAQGSIRAVDVLDDLIAVCCERQYLAVLTVSHNKFLVLYHLNKMDSPASVKFIDSRHLLVSDFDRNLNVVEINGQMIDVVAGINLEVWVGHKMEKINVPEYMFGFEFNAVAVSMRTGNLFIVIPITKEDYDVLIALQKALEKKLQCFEKFFEDLWAVKRRSKKVDGVSDFVNGDFLEEFEKLGKEDQKNISEKVSKSLGRKYDEERLKEILFKIKKIH